MHKKKFFAVILLAVAAFVCGAFALAGCGEKKYVPRRQDPTCTEAGFTEEYCEATGNSRYHEVLPALGHDFIEYGGVTFGVEFLGMYDK